MPPETHIDVLTWLVALGAGLAAAGAVAAWLILGRLKRAEAAVERLTRLDEIGAHVKALSEREDDLDLRRLEHVLIDIRDGQRRVEDRMLALVEARAGESLTGDRAPTSTSAMQPAGAAAGAALTDRIVTRLLALGYERITFVTASADIARIASEAGAITVEARRDGAACKGRVIVAEGRIEDLQIQSAYSTFP
jgi:hypothetical protein